MVTPEISRAGGWTDVELRNPHLSADKPGKVRAMFAAIARSYDLNNRVHSLGRDQAWRRFAVRAAPIRPGDDVLDVACGTGDLTHALARTGAASVVGADFTPEMLAIAERKRGRLAARGGPAGAQAAKVRYVEADAMDLPFSDGSFDVVTIAFGIRNVADPRRGLSEFARVLRPGGRLVVLEFDRPRVAPMSWLYDLYCGWIMPRTATLLAGDRSGAYRYLPRSVGTFLTREEMCGAMAAAGLVGVGARRLSLGICVCYRGVKPGGAGGP